jgi:Tfp pilus assembly protein PilX
MTNALAYLKNDSGFALVTGLVILVLLTAIGTYAINMTEIDQSLAANLKSSKQAFYLADAGIEWGRQQVRASTDIPPLPANSTRTLSSGSYTVNFTITPTTPAFAYTVAMQSVGTIGNASKTVQAVVTRTYDLSDSAIALRGNEANSSFTGNAFSVDGRDYDHVTGEISGGTTQYGITVPTQSLETGVDSALSSQQKDNVMGTGGTGTTASIGVSTALPSSTVTSLGDDLCNAAPAANKFNTPNNGSYSLSGPNTWGTRASPQIYCVTGVGTPGNMLMDVDGNFSGVGVLVVRDADLVIHGAFHFEGLIIVTGQNVGFELSGGGNKDLYGSVVVNQTGSDVPSFRYQEESFLQGAAHVLYSRSALNVARQLVPAAVLSSVIGTLPTTVQQVSWSEVNK